MDMLHEFIMNILGGIEVFIWAWAICQVEFTREKTKWVVALMIFVLSWMLSCNLANETFVFPVRLMGQMLGMILLFQGKIVERIVKYWFSLFYVEMIYLPIQAVLFLINIFCQGILEIQFYEEIRSIIAILSVVFLGLQIKKRKEWCVWIRNIPIGYFVLGILCSYCANGVSAITRMFSAEWNMRIRFLIEVLLSMVMFFFYMLGIGFAFVNLWKEQYKRENALKDEYLKMSKKHYEELTAHIREVRSLRHDMKNHVLIVDNYIQERKLAEAEAYLQEIKAHQEWKNKPLINVGNELINAVLSDGIKRGEGVKLDCEGVLPSNISISDFDLCTIFSNLISNSIEACERLSEKERKILLQIKVFQNQLLIYMENPLEQEVLIEELGTFTSKKNKEKHGFGIYNVKQVVEKYAGEIKFYSEGGKFCVRIYIPF